MRNPRVVYTAVFGDYDDVPAVDARWACDFLCFTDNPRLAPGGWQVVVVPRGEPPADANRRYKMLPHLYLPEYERGLYVDGNIRIVSDPTPLFGKYLDHDLLALPRHPERTCAYQEARRCVERGLVDAQTVEAQMSRYAAEGFPENWGLTANGIILRRHLDPAVAALMEAWWKEYSGGGRRDQLSLPYLIWKSGIGMAWMEESALSGSNRYFRLTLHAGSKRTSLAGRLADHINCNRHRNWLYGSLHAVTSRLGRSNVVRRMAR
jgi:hypothetical protein